MTYGKRDAVSYASLCRSQMEEEAGEMDHFLVVNRV